MKTWDDLVTELDLVFAGPPMSDEARLETIAHIQAMMTSIAATRVIDLLLCHANGNAENAVYMIATTFYCFGKAQGRREQIDAAIERIAKL